MIFKCPKCDKSFEMSYIKWLFKTPFHSFGKRLTRCPHCKVKSWLKPSKKNALR